MGNIFKSVESMGLIFPIFFLFVDQKFYKRPYILANYQIVFNLTTGTKIVI